MSMLVVLGVLADDATPSRRTQSANREITKPAIGERVTKCDILHAPECKRQQRLHHRRRRGVEIGETIGRDTSLVAVGVISIHTNHTPLRRIRSPLRIKEIARKVE